MNLKEFSTEDQVVYRDYPSIITHRSLPITQLPVKRETESTSSPDCSENPFLWRHRRKKDCNGKRDGMGKKIRL